MMENNQDGNGEANWESKNVCKYWAENELTALQNDKMTEVMRVVSSEEVIGDRSLML